MTCRRSCGRRGCAASRRCPTRFAHESYIDELATEAGVDPIEYRLRYLKDPRAVDLVNAVAKRADWTPRPVWKEPVAEGDIVRGRGFAYALYVHSKFPGYGAAWSAWIADVAVNKATGDVSVTRVVAGQDSGLMINPDGVRHQIHGNVIQSTSRALMEEVSFDRNSVTSREWGAYPIIKFPDIPKIDVLMLPRQDQPPLGVGESASVPSAAAIANAIFDATGVRFRELPFTPERILAGLRGGQPAPQAALPGAGASEAGPTHASKSVCQTARRIRKRCCHGCRNGQPRRARAAVAVDRADRAAGSVDLFGRDDREGSAACGARRLRGVPYAGEWRDQRRRPRHRDAVRHHLLDQHHARSPRPASARGRIPPSSARCARASTATAGISIRRFRITILRKPRDADLQALYAYLMAQPAVTVGPPRNRARVPVQSASADGRDGMRCFTTARHLRRTLRNRRHGIAAPIWSKASAIAAPAIRRATRSARKRPRPISPAVSLKGGKRRR